MTNLRLPLSSWSRLLIAWFLLILAAQPASAIDARSFIWEVRSAQGKAFVLGSIHVGSPDLYPLAPAIDRAFDEASVLAVEADPRQQQGMMAALTRGLYAPGDNLRNHLPAPVLERLGRVLPRYGLTLDAAISMKPFMLMTLIEASEAMRAGYDPQLGIDLHFLERASKRGMKVVELESIEQQLALMDSFSDDEAQAMLQQMLSAVEKNEMTSDLKQMFAAWKDGDAQRLERIVDRSLGPDPKARQAFMETMNYGRNQAMADKIERYLRSGETHLVIVGALHLVGERGVIALLRKRGYKIDQR